MIPSPEKPSTTSAKSTIKYHIRKVFALQQSFRLGEEHFKIIQISKTVGGYENCQNQKIDARYDPKIKRGDLQHESQIFKITTEIQIFTSIHQQNRLRTHFLMDSYYMLLL